MTSENLDLGTKLNERRGHVYIPWEMIEINDFDIISTSRCSPLRLSTLRPCRLYHHVLFFLKHLCSLLTAVNVRQTSL